MDTSNPDIADLRHLAWSTVFQHILPFLADMCRVAPFAALDTSAWRCLMLPDTWTGSHQDLRGNRRRTTFRYFQHMESIVGLAARVFVDEQHFPFICRWRRPFSMLWTPCRTGLCPLNISDRLFADTWLVISHNIILCVSERLCMFKASVQVDFEASPPAEVWLVLSNFRSLFDIQNAMTGSLSTFRMVYTCRLRMDRTGQVCKVDWYFNSTHIDSSVLPLLVAPHEEDGHRYHILSLSWNKYVIKAYASGVFIGQQLFGRRAAAPPVVDNVFFAVGIGADALRNARVRVRPMPVHYLHAFQGVACVLCVGTIFEAVAICQCCHRPICSLHGRDVRLRGRVACFLCKSHHVGVIHDII